ncbi:MAG: hypothetical protein ABSC06_27380 [Rhodopila sp.]
MPVAPMTPAKMRQRQTKQDKAAANLRDVQAANGLASRNGKSLRYSICGVGRPSRLSNPDRPQPGDRQLGIAYRVANIPMSEKLLDQPGVGSFVRQHVSGGVPQHVGMHVEADTSVLGGSLDNPCHHVCRQHAAALRDKYERAVAGLLKPPQASNFIPIQRMHAVVAALDAENVYCLLPWRVEVEMCPFDVSRFSRTQPVAIHQAEQDLIAQALAASFPGGLDHSVRLLGRQVVPFGNMRTSTAKPHRRHLSNSASQPGFETLI